jgi:hypothetical protein
MSVCLSVYLPIYLSIYLSIYRSIYLSPHSVRRSIHPSIHRSVYLWLYSPLLRLGCFFSFLILYAVGRTPWTGDQPVARPIPTHRRTQTKTDIHALSGIRTQIPVFLRPKTVHALYCAATVIGEFSTVRV